MQLKLLEEMFVAKLVPILEKKLFNSLAISLGSVTQSPFEFVMCEIAFLLYGLTFTICLTVFQISQSFLILLW